METKQEVCEHCGQELKKASEERQEIKDIQIQNITDVNDALTIRQDKLDAASQEMLAIVLRIEKKLGADAQALEDVRALEKRIREKVAAQAESEEEDKTTVN